MEASNNDLPKTRFALLKDRLKRRFFDFILLSLLTTVFLIPLVVWMIVVNYVLISQVNNDNYLFMTLLIYLPYIPFGMVFGLGVSGALYYCKRLAWGEGSNAATDFFYGLRKNIKFSLIGFLIIFTAYALLKIGSMLLAFASDNNILNMVTLGIMYVAFLLIFMITSFTLTQGIIYQGSFRQLFANGMRFTIGMFGWNLLIFSLVLLPFFAYEFIPFPIAQYVSIAVSGLFYFAFSFFVFTIYSHSIFDLTINDDYPEIYRKGLVKENRQPE